MLTINKIVDRFYENSLKIILAGIKENLILKYPHLEKEIEKFAKNDPSGKLKYIQWQAKKLEYDEKNLFRKPLTYNFPKISHLCNSFYKLARSL